MNYIRPKVFDITQKRPAVLLVGNGLNRCMGDKTSWANAIQHLAKDDAALDNIDNINYSIRATVTADDDEQKRWSRYKKLFDQDFEYIDNPLLKKLLGIKFDAVLTTNYTYELENALDETFPRSAHRDDHACTTAAYVPPAGSKVSPERLLNVYNCINGVNIWHIHGEVNDPSSMILTHEEYGRLVSELIRRDETQVDPHAVSFGSWMDYFIYGDLYVLGQGINFAEFDLWWLLARRRREKSGMGRAIYYNPMRIDRVLSDVEEALDQIGMKIVTCGKSLPDFEKDSPEECDQKFYDFYEAAYYDLSYRMEFPVSQDTEKLIDYRDKCVDNKTKANKLRLLYQLSKTQVFVHGENVKSPSKGTVTFMPVTSSVGSGGRYRFKKMMFLYSSENAYPRLTKVGEELRPMTGLEALDLAQSSQKIEALCLDLFSRDNGVVLSLEQAEYMRHDPEELWEYVKAANDKDLTRRKVNAKIASEPTHHIASFICSSALPASLEEAQSDIRNMKYFNYELVLHFPEVLWVAPKSAKTGDIVFFALAPDAKAKISALLEELKKTSRYPKLGNELKQALADCDKYAGRIFAISQVCEDPEEIDPDDPFFTPTESQVWSRTYKYSSVTNIRILDHPVDVSGFGRAGKLQEGSSTPLYGEDFDAVRELIRKKNKDMKFPLYFEKSTASPAGEADAGRTRQDPDSRMAGKPDSTTGFDQPDNKSGKDEKPDAVPVTKEPAGKITLEGLLKEAGVEVIDKRTNGGALWIIGGQELKPLVQRCKELGVNFVYKQGGGKVSKNRDAWWSK